MATSYQNALSAWLSAASSFKTDFTNAVLQEYGVSLGSALSSWKSSLSALPGTMQNPIAERIVLKSEYSGLSTMEDDALRTLESTQLVGSTSAITDIKISCANRFVSWFISGQANIDFSGLSSIEYGPDVTEEQKQYIEAAIGYNGAQ